MMIGRLNYGVSSECKIAQTEPLGLWDTANVEVRNSRRQA